MHAFRIFLFITFPVIALIGCGNTATMSYPDGEESGVRESDPIEGVWICTEETASHFGSNVVRNALYLRRHAGDTRDAGDGHSVLQAQACFVRDGDFSMTWELRDARYDEDARRLTILDADEDTLIAYAEGSGERLRGAMHFQDGSVDSLSFVRMNDPALAQRCFFPLPPDADGHYTYHPPDQLEDGVRTATLGGQHMRDAMRKVMERILGMEFGHLESLLILHHGALVVEEYFYGFDRDRLHRINSCTKSVTSLLLGSALEQHPEVRTDQPLFSLFPRHAELGSGWGGAMTLAHVMTMTAGYDTDEGDDPDEADDWVRALLVRKRVHQPGSTFAYDNGCTEILCALIEQLEGVPVHDYAKQRLFDPMGISTYSWTLADNGFPECASGLHLRPRDMAKIGLLVLNNGAWQGKPLIPSAWIRESTTPHVRESDFFDYGYQWWCRSKDNKHWWERSATRTTEEPRLVTALGAGGQYIMVLRDLDMVVVTTASDYHSGHIARSKIPMVIEAIVPALLKGN
ncbi:beta-lactamase family protein [bacterium]|nr:beta-lactamase family protein [bacterium]